MNRQSFRDTYSDIDGSRKKRKLIITVLSILCVTLVVGAVLGWYFSRKRECIVIIETPTCTGIPHENKIDCHPDLPVNEAECLNRGCCYYTKSKNITCSSSLPALNVPVCYYPSDYEGYNITSVSETTRRIEYKGYQAKTTRRIEIKLERTKSSGFVKDSLNLGVRILYVDGNSLRIKITDEDSERYEIPIQLYYQTKELTTPLYSVNVDSKSGLLTVSRSSTGSVIYPEDNNTYAIDEQFLWGSNLMIIQVLYPNTSTVNAYFPGGLWYDAVTGDQRKSTGEKFELTKVNIGIHLSVRGGAIIPAQMPALTTTETRKSPFTLAVALDEELKAYGELYWDDGDSLTTYENGFYDLIQFQVNNGTFTSTVVNSGYQTNVNLQSINIIGFDKFPTNVSLNDLECVHTNDLALNSTINSENGNGSEAGVHPGILGINLLKPVSTEDSPCHYFRLGSILVIQTKPISLLSPISARWE